MILGIFWKLKISQNKNQEEHNLLYGILRNIGMFMKMNHINGLLRDNRDLYLDYLALLNSYDIL
jgi:hypothetical protein